MNATDKATEMIVSLHDHFKIRITDWLLSAILLNWSLALFWTDPKVWALPTFSGLNQIASQQAWALVGTFVGLARLLALFINGAVRRTPHARALGAFVGCGIWFQMTLGMIWADWTGPGIGIFPWLMMADAFNCWRAAGDARTSDDRARERRRSAALNAHSA